MYGGCLRIPRSVQTVGSGAAAALSSAAAHAGKCVARGARGVGCRGRLSRVMPLGEMTFRVGLAPSGRLLLPSGFNFTILFGGLARGTAPSGSSRWTLVSEFP